MANCDSGNQTLDPYQTILDNASKITKTLENQAGGILPLVHTFRELGDAFPAEDISPTSAVNSALDKMTADALCAGKTDLAPINDLAEDCLNDALRGVRKYINDILGNMGDGIDLIADILALPENLLMKLFQKLWSLCDNISGLVDGLDGKIQCVSLSGQEDDYQDQIDILNGRINTVTDDLYLSDDGSFNPDKLMGGFQGELKDNIDLYEIRSNEVQADIEDNIKTTVDLTATVNPRRNF